MKFSFKLEIKTSKVKHKKEKEPLITNILKWIFLAFMEYWLTEFVFPKLVAWIINIIVNRPFYFYNRMFYFEEKYG